MKPLRLLPHPHRPVVDTSVDLHRKPLCGLRPTASNNRAACIRVQPGGARPVCLKTSRREFDRGVQGQESLSAALYPRSSATDASERVAAFSVSQPTSSRRGAHSLAEGFVSRAPRPRALLRFGNLGFGFFTVRHANTLPAIPSIVKKQPEAPLECSNAARHEGGS
jgi:hypothetical protein